MCYYLIGSSCSKVVILRSGLCGHLSCYSRDMEQQISKQLHRAEPTNQQQHKPTVSQYKSDIYSIANVLQCI